MNKLLIVITLVFSFGVFAETVKTEDSTIKNALDSNSIRVDDSAIVLSKMIVYSDVKVSDSKLFSIDESGFLSIKQNTEISKRITFLDNMKNGLTFNVLNSNLTKKEVFLYNLPNVKSAIPVKVLLVVRI